MQAELFREQRRLSSFFCIQPAPTAAAHQASEERVNDIQQEIREEIGEKQERILELRKEIGDDEEAVSNAEEDEFDLEPEGDEEVIFDAVAPMLEEDLTQTRCENEDEIRTIQEEIEDMAAKLKHAN